MFKKDKHRKVSFPQMGNLAIPVASMLTRMGAEVILPPANNNETLTLGTRHSVETVCLPYKIVLGNFIQSIESGANTLLMFQAPGTCRLGNYAANLEAKLKELGYDFEMVIFDMYKGKLQEIASKFAYACNGPNIIDVMSAIRIGFSKFNAVDVIERKLLYTRPREIRRGQADRVYQQGRKLIELAENPGQVKNAVKTCLKELENIPVNKNMDVVKVSITGEFYVLLDPFTNMDIEKELGYLGCEVERQVMMSDWTNNLLLPKFLYNKISHRDRSVHYAADYMLRSIGGDCIESIGDAVFASKSRVDGVVHIGPFNCTPEIVSQSILPHVSKNEDIPVISLTMDEHTGKAGVITRLEAFVDLIKRRRTITKRTDKELVLCT
jgi:predicted nucleotide-binding protein (sugar kinase/HSP70/actin superfamily)